VLFVAVFADLNLQLGLAALFDLRFGNLRHGRSFIYRFEGQMGWRVVIGVEMKRFFPLALLVGSLALSTQAHAQGQTSGVKIGTLSCHVQSGWGFIFGSSKAVRCTFAGGDRIEHYDGSISKFGVDIGYQQSGVLIWSVVAPTEHMEHGALQGHYGGLTAGATAGVGVAANALVGGSTKGIVLQPLSIEGTTGLNVAGGIGELTLHYHPGE